MEVGLEIFFVHIFWSGMKQVLCKFGQDLQIVLVFGPHNDHENHTHAHKDIH